MTSWWNVARIGVLTLPVFLLFQNFSSIVRPFYSVNLPTQSTDVLNPSSQPDSKCFTSSQETKDQAFNKWFFNKNQVFAYLYPNSSCAHYQDSPVGVNMTYFVDTPAAWNKNPANGLAAHLGDLGVKMVRYMGEESDNFNWKTNQTVEKAFYPLETGRWGHGLSPTETLSSKEFVTRTRGIGAEPLLVVNLESAFLSAQGDTAKAKQIADQLSSGKYGRGSELDPYVELARDWVKESFNFHAKGVRFWEIGNESFYSNTHYALTAVEYARAFKIYAQEMRKVSPTEIYIGATGPNTFNGVGSMDELSSQGLSKLRSLSLETARQYTQNNSTRWWSDAVCILNDPTVTVATLKNNASTLKPRRKSSGACLYPAIVPAKSWWQTVVEIAGPEIDFFTVHIYEAPQYQDQNASPPTLKLWLPLQWATPLIELKAKLKGRNSSNRVYVTEVNLEWFSNDLIAKGERAPLMAELFGRMAEAGIERFQVWPLRYDYLFESNGKPRKYWTGAQQILAWDAANGKFKPEPSFHMLAEFARLPVARKVPVYINSPDQVYSYVTADADLKHIGGMFINRWYTYPADIWLPPWGKLYTYKVAIYTPSADGVSQQKWEYKSLNANEWFHFKLAPRSVAFIHLYE